MDYEDRRFALPYPPPDRRPKAEPEATVPMPTPPTPGGASGSIRIEAALVRLRDEALGHLHAGYPGAGAAERLLLRLAAADAACVAHLQEAELALVGKVHEILIHDPVKIAPLSRVLRDIDSVTTAVRTRVQASLTAASTIMAQSRVARLHRQGTEG